MPDRKTPGGRLFRVKVSATASRSEVGLVYVAAVMQGLALVTFPAASSIFTSPDGFGFDSTRYGALFLPQVLLAILASAFAPRLARRWSLRRVLLAGLAGDIVSMLLLALSRLLLGSPDMAFGVLLLATGALGFGFGATVMALNTYAEAFFPRRADRAVLALNALLGLGTALAPVLVAVVVGLGAWWLLPVLVAGLAALLFAVAYAQPLATPAGAAGAGRPTSLNWTDLPHRFWLYAAAVFVYGIVETLNGNWAMLYLSSERGVSSQGASLALAAFWVMVTVGRDTDRDDHPVRAGTLDLCRASGIFAGGVSARRAGAERSRRDHRVRSRRPGMFGISAIEHQLRRQRVSAIVGGDGRWPHRVLSAWLRRRRVRHRTAAEPAGAVVRNDFRGGEHRGGTHHRHRVVHHPKPTRIPPRT